jgi:hypothetical protein
MYKKDDDFDTKRNKKVNSGNQDTTQITAIHPHLRLENKGNNE